MRFKAFSIVVFSLLFSVQLLSAQTWETTKRITWSSIYFQRPSVAVDSNNHLHAIWYGGDHEIYYKNSTNGGLTWGMTKRVTWNPGWSVVPSIAVDSSNDIHVVWHDNSKDSNFEIFYKKSTDEGTSWSIFRRLTWNSSSSYEPKISIDSNNNVHVVWFDESPGNNEIFYKRSTDGGLTWSSSDRLTWTPSWTDDPVIAIDSNDHIHIVWKDDWEIYYRRSTDGGKTWSATKRLTWNSGLSWRAAIAVDSNNDIHMVWQDDSKENNDELFHKRSTDGGSTWSKYKRITWNTGISEYPTIASDPNNHIHVVWQDDSKDSIEEIYYKKSTDGGLTWSKYKRLTWNINYSFEPDINIDSSNNIHIVWSDKTPGNWEIFYKKGIQ